MASSNFKVRTRRLSAPILATSLAFGLTGQAFADETPEQPIAGQTVQDPPKDPSTQDDVSVQDTVIIEGQANKDTALGRVLTPVFETPQAISSLSQEDLLNRGTTNLNDALRGIPGISLGAGETSFQGNNAILRGFPTRGDQFLDGIRDFGFYFRDTFNDESVEVFKGPSSILFGRGSTGGVIHRVSKSPFDETAVTARFTGGLDETARAEIDVNLASDVANGTGLRINAMAHRSGVQSRDFAEFKRWGFAPTLTVGLDGPTQLTISYYHQEEDNRPDYGIPWFPGTPDAPGAPAAVDRSNFYGFENDIFDTNVDIGTIKVQHALNDQFTLRTQLRYSSNDRAFRYGEAIIAAGTPQDTPLEDITVSRNLFEGFSTDTFLQNQSDIVFTGDIGPTSHKLITGFEIGRETSNPTFIQNFNVPGTSLTNPTSPVYISTDQFVRLTTDGVANTVGLYAVDTIDIGDHWSIVAGIRWDRFEADYSAQGFNPDGSPAALTEVDRVDKEFSYRGALVYKPTSYLSFYGAYGTSFNPSGEGIESFISAGRSVSMANINLEPETSRSAEIGAKLSLFDDAALLTASLFRVERDNVRVPDPDNIGFNTLGGEQRVDGFEIEFSGNPIPRLRINGGYTFLDSQTLASSPNGPIVGERLLIAPRHQATLSTWYDFTERYSAGVTIIGQSERLGQNTARSFLVAPGFVLVDIGAEAQLTDRVALRVNVNNLFDELYFDQLHPVHVIPGAGRTALATLTVSF